MFEQSLANKIDAVARKEIETYGLPTQRHYNLSLEKGVELAKN